MGGATCSEKVVASFEMIKAVHAELEVAVAATTMAGPYGWRGQLVDPAGAGVAGLLKSLRHEAGAMLVKVVDVEHPAARAEAEHVAGLILAEIERGGRRAEVAYRDGTRLVPRVVHEPLDLSGPTLRRLGPESVLVAIGGSRGVTAAGQGDRGVSPPRRAGQPRVAGQYRAGALDSRAQTLRRIARGWSR
jgi:hypothetical protein